MMANTKSYNLNLNEIVYNRVFSLMPMGTNIILGRGARYLMGEDLRVVWAEFSTLS